VFTLRILGTDTEQKTRKTRVYHVLSREYLLGTRQSLQSTDYSVQRRDLSYCCCTSITDWEKPRPPSAHMADLATRHPGTTGSLSAYFLGLVLAAWAGTRLGDACYLNFDSTLVVRLYLVFTELHLFLFIPGVVLSYAPASIG
jgi:hypothetical protein